MMVAIRFNNKGEFMDARLDQQGVGTNAADFGEGFEFYDIGEILLDDLCYCKLNGGTVVLDAQKKQAAEKEVAKLRRITKIKALLEELDHDINACTDGIIKPRSEQEYRAERVALRNELRVLEGKSVLTAVE